MKNILRSLELYIEGWKNNREVLKFFSDPAKVGDIVNLKVYDNSEVVEVTPQNYNSYFLETGKPMKGALMVNGVVVDAEKVCSKLLKQNLAFLVFADEVRLGSPGAM